MRLPGWATRNIKLKAVACGLALVTWTVVVYAGNPPDSRTVTVAVPQDTLSLPQSYVLATAIPEITVRIEGTREHIDAFQTTSLKVIVNYSAIHHVGLQNVPVSVVNNDHNVDLTDAPSSVVANVDALDTKGLTVHVKYTHTPPQGYRIAGNPTVSPDSLVVSGARRELDGLQAIVSVDLGTRKSVLSQDFNVSLVDRNGRPVNDVGFVGSQTVHVDIGIISVTGTRSAGINLTTTGQPAPGHYISGVGIQPSTIVLTGPEDILNGLDSVQTRPVDITGINSERTVNAQLQLPAGVSANPSTVTIHITVGVPATPTPSPSATPSPTPTPRPSPTPTPPAPT